MRQHPKIVARQEVAKIEDDGYVINTVDNGVFLGGWNLKHANGNSISVVWDIIPFEHVVIMKNGKIVKFII